MSATLTQYTAADYQAAFEAERVKEYPIVDAFVDRQGRWEDIYGRRFKFEVDRKRLEEAARVLACPLKKSPPNWQHGRVLYAAASRYLNEIADCCGESSAGYGMHPVVLDIGTAKGFSALCLLWAVAACGRVTDFTIHSVDVIDPKARVRRNTVAEVDGLKTLEETLQPWWNGTNYDGDDTAKHIEFFQMTGIDYLKSGSGLIDIAFVDGKHTGEVVAQEGRLLAKRQRMNGLAIFDDLHLPDIAKAVQGLSDLYDLEILRILPNRAYAIGVRRG